MSGPFGVSMTVISGQKFSREIVVAASTFLSMGYLSINLIGTDGDIRQEFLTALEVFGYREGISYGNEPGYFAKKLIEPSNSPSTKAFFWLALDKEGESLAMDIFSAHGELPDKRVYRSVNKLNLIEQTVSAPPQVNIPLAIWKETRHTNFSLWLNYHKLKPKVSRQSYMNKHTSPSPEEKLYLIWCESLYEILIPWQDTIKNIQSDLS